MFHALYIIIISFWLCLPAMAQKTDAIQAPKPAPSIQENAKPLSLTSPKFASEIPAITVLADRALTIPLARLASDYSRKNQTSVTVSFAPSFEQMVAIEEGESADIFISAQPDALSRLKQSGLFDVYSFTPITKTRMALVTSTPYPNKSLEILIESLKEMKRTNDFLLAIANSAATAEGFYSAQIIDKVQKELFLSGNLVQLQNTQDIFDFNNSMPSFGIVFSSDAIHQNELRTLGNFPSEWHDEILFNGVVIAGGQMNASRKFLKYIQSDEAQRYFTNYGFISLNK